MSVDLNESQPILPGSSAEEVAFGDQPALERADQFSSVLRFKRSTTR